MSIASAQIENRAAFPSNEQEAQDDAAVYGNNEGRRYVDEPMRNYEVVSLRKDGSVFIGQSRAPALPLFENAFSAFAHGTMVLTSQGNVSVEDLHPGDMIVKADGKSAPLLWIGSSTFVPADTGRRTPLLRVMSDSLGAGRPSGFLTFGPSARVLHTPDYMRADAKSRKMLTLLRDMVDGVNIIEMTPPTPIRLYHLCLPHHAAINACGLEMETFHPGPDIFTTLPVNLRETFMGLFPFLEKAADFGALRYPRVPARTDEIA